jgi:hypothetical protein
MYGRCTSPKRPRGSPQRPNRRSAPRASVAGPEKKHEARRAGGRVVEAMPACISLSSTIGASKTPRAPWVNGFFERFALPAKAHFHKRQLTIYAGRIRIRSQRATYAGAGVDSRVNAHNPAGTARGHATHRRRRAPQLSGTMSMLSALNIISRCRQHRIKRHDSPDTSQSRHSCLAASSSHCAMAPPPPDYSGPRTLL